MKRFSQLLCLVLVLAMIMVIPAQAAEMSSRASDFFGRRSCYLWRVSDSEIQVWFDVTAVRTMTELGVSEIRVQRSTNAVNWTTVRTYYKANYPQMICANTAGHAGYVSFTPEAGYYYRAYVEFYAKDSTGTAVYPDYTSYI